MNVAPARKTAEDSMESGWTKSRKKKGTSKKRPATIVVLGANARTEDILAQLLRDQGYNTRVLEATIGTHEGPELRRVGARTQ